VEGNIEVKGTAMDMIAICNALARNTSRPEGKLARIVRSFTHDKSKDAEAIRYHYDVSNDFYQLFLDPAMVYSCAYFETAMRPGTGAVKKIDHILKKIQLQPGQTLLDIGCGWGALVIRAAQQYGARCVGVTLSENQYALARERVAAAGLEHLIEIRLQDYRDVTGQFDRITSVGMFEHVGIKHLPEYFSIINKLLAPDGMAMNHGITSTDPDNGETPYGGGEFIEKYVFPHGELAHIGNVLKTMQQGGWKCWTWKTCGATMRAPAPSGRKFRGPCRADPSAGGRAALPHLACLPGRLRLCLRAGLISLYQIVCAGRRSSTCRSRNYMYGRQPRPC
jgi:cyclopropane-fatty-acyl-phospholipid synthase